MANSEAATILFLAANPVETSRLRLGQEVRQIHEGLLRSPQRDYFRLEEWFAVNPRDIGQALLDLNPQIVHFSGHGTGDEGLVFENEDGSSQLVSTEALAALFKLFSDQVFCVLLNGCYTEVQAEAISQHIPYVIGMSQAIGDSAAIEFALGFYKALGGGRSIEFAYEFGCNAIQMVGIPEHLTPVIKRKQMLDEDTSQDLTTHSKLYFSQSASKTVSKAISKKQQRLQDQINDLETNHADLRKKLQRFKKDHITESDSEIKYKLEQRISEYEVKLQEIEQEIELLENKQSST